MHHSFPPHGLVSSGPVRDAGLGEEGEWWAARTSDAVSLVSLVRQFRRFLVEFWHTVSHQKATDISMMKNEREHSSFVIQDCATVRNVLGHTLT